VQIASVQTLIKRGVPDADVVLIDEVHKWFEFYGKWLCDPAWQQKPIIGLSATPWRKGLKNYFNRLVRASTTQDLIDQGLLSDFVVFAPDHPDLSKVRTVAGEYHEGELSATMQVDNGLTANIVETWLQKARGRPTFCFAVDRSHAKKLEQQFIAAGVRTAYQDQHTKDHERKAIKRCFHDGSYEVVVSVGTMIIGTDWDVRCISDAQPTLSEMRHVQKIGRGLRTAEGKDHCLILDHASNHNGRPTSLGFVTDIDQQHDHLYGGDAKTTSVSDNIRLPKECPQCGYLKAPGKATCPNCSFKAEAHSKIEPTAGELKELERKRKMKGEMMDILPQMFAAECKAYALQHGYKSGWWWIKFQERYKVKPSRQIARVPPATVISYSTENWIKSRNISWAKSKRRNNNQQTSTQAVNDFNARLDGLREAPQDKFVQGTLMTRADFEDL
jgi:DNA repair protein RadD